MGKINFLSVFVFTILSFCFIFFGQKANRADAQTGGCMNWSLVKNLGGVVTYDPSIAAAGDRLIVTGAGTNKALFANEYVISTGASAWYTLDGTLYSGTKMTANNGVITVSVIGGGNAVFSRQYQSPNLWTAWHNDGQIALGNTGPTQTTLGSILYRVIRTTSNAAEIDKCGDVCLAGTVSGCKVCNANALSWTDDYTKCATGQKCQSGVCVCVPKTCTFLGYDCGSASDGCGGKFDCGSCAAPKTCTANKCAVPQICTPNFFSGCQVCNTAGTAWVDTDSKCAIGQKCRNGACFWGESILGASGFAVSQMSRAEILTAIAQIQAQIADLQQQLAAMN